MDVWFDGYDVRNAAAANRIIAFLREHEDEIDKIFVTFAGTRPQFEATLNAAAPLANERPVTDVIRHAVDHFDHFHIRLKRRNPQW